MGFDGPISGHVVRLHHLVHDLTVTHSLQVAFISTVDHGLWHWMTDPLIQNEENS